MDFERLHVIIDVRFTFQSLKNLFDCMDVQHMWDTAGEKPAKDADREYWLCTKAAKHLHNKDPDFPIFRMFLILTSASAISLKKCVFWTVSHAQCRKQTKKNKQIQTALNSHPVNHLWGQGSHTYLGVQRGQSASEICPLNDAADFKIFTLWW